jgi:hypothetical protein
MPVDRKRIVSRCCRMFAAVLAVAGLGVAPSADAQQTTNLEYYAQLQELQVVDCLVPGQVRVVGGRVYQTPRRPGRMTGAECRQRGGEYLAYDPANYTAALNMWLETAQTGDAEAQDTVGQMYERGVTGVPDYEAAAMWYRRAAEQNYSRAQYHLGSLYEQGLGVERDAVEALNWYRRSSGLAENSIIFAEAAAAAQAELRAQLEREIAARDDELARVARELQEREQTLTEERRNRQEIEAEINSLRERRTTLETQVATARDRLAQVPDAAPPPPGPSRTPPDPRRREFGRYYALIIGVQNYDLLDDLESPLNDLARVKTLLEQRYGFIVQTLADPSQLDLMRKVNELSQTLEEDDNLLIYFAGHGNRLAGARETGYWLPANAERPPDDTLWVPNEFVTRHLGRLAAKRVLVVSDSCYAGLLGDDPGYVMVGERTYSPEYVRWKMPKRSRLVLASGTDQPVAEADGNSVFARALVEELERNDGLLTAPELFLRVRNRVRQSPLSERTAEGPTLKVIKDAGHEVGDFFFIPG